MTLMMKTKRKRRSSSRKKIPFLYSCLIRVGFEQQNDMSDGSTYLRNSKYKKIYIYLFDKKRGVVSGNIWTAMIISFILLFLCFTNKQLFSYLRHKISHFLLFILKSHEFECKKAKTKCLPSITITGYHIHSLFYLSFFHITFLFVGSEVR